MVSHDLCLQALKLNPELWRTTQLVARVEGKATFPIKSLEMLVSALSDRNKTYCKLDDLKLTAKNAQEFFPQAFFPIEDEDDMLKKIYAALCWSREVHKLEKQLENHKKTIGMKGGA